MKILERLHAKVQEARYEGFRNFVLWAHSLGSVAAFDYVFRFRKKFKLPPDLNLEALITFGAPIPFFSAAMGYPYSDIRLPENVKRWINFWDKDDAIACRCAPHFPKGVVQDVPVNVASFARPDRAHTGYWNKPSVIHKMVDVLLER